MSTSPPRSRARAGLLTAVSLAALQLATTPPAAAQDAPEEALPPPRYTVQTNEPHTGTRIPSTVVSGFRVPLNRTYAQLTEAEKRLVRSQYEVMRAEDEPPYPLGGLYPLYRDLQKLVDSTHETGVLALVANVDASGAVTSVGVLQPGPPALVERAASLLMLTPFKPALCGSQACSMGFPVRLTVRRQF